MNKNKVNNDKITDSPLFGINPDTVSGTDCTGLIPAAPESKAELHSYDDIYSYKPKFKK